MTDTREEIIVRLVELLGEVDGIEVCVRDRDQLPAKKLPGIIVLDGTERLKTSIQGKQFTEMPAAYFTLLPQVFMQCRPRDNQTNETLDNVPSPIGPELSDWRIKIMKAVLNDDTIVALCTSGGQIEYRGCDTDMQTGSTIGAMGAMIQFHFAFTYPLDPSDL